MKRRAALTGVFFILGLCLVSAAFFAGYLAAQSFFAASYSDMESVIGALLQQWGHIDILVNNAGIASLGLFTDMNPSDYEQLISVNLLSVLHCCRLTVPSMVEQKSGPGAQPRGRCRGKRR